MAVPQTLTDALLPTLNELGFRTTTGSDQYGREHVLAQSASLRLKAAFGGSEYVVLLAPLEEEAWFDLRAIIRYIEKGSTRYSEDPAMTYVSPIEYAKAIRRHHDTIIKLVTIREEREKLRKEIQNGLDEFVRDLHARALASKSKRK